MKTKRASNTTGDQTIDFRKDTPPTNWLMKRALEYAEHAGYPKDKAKLPSDYHREFITEISEFLCEPICANGQLAADCICSLVEQLASPDVDLVVPKDEFLEIVRAAGYSQKDALAHYRNYFRGKQWDKYGPEILRLDEESENACNWGLELNSSEAYTQATAAENEMEALRRKMDQELEDITSA